MIASKEAIQDNPAMRSNQPESGNQKPLMPLPASMLHFLSVLGFSILFSTLTFQTPVHAQVESQQQQSCPDLSPYYIEEGDWQALHQQLAVFYEQCLNSTEYFALYGAAHLNSGNIAEATEALELALLLDPENGAAKIDYAQALFQQGELFSAMELNQQLLARSDLPSNIRDIIEQRQDSWQGFTRESSTQLDILAGYDNNLNGAPDIGQVTLTLAGEPVLLTLNPEFRQDSGPYFNARLANRYRILAPRHQHNFTTEIRGRASEYSSSNLLQLDGRYALIRPGRRNSWQLNSGLSHLQFGGNSLYTATDVSARYHQNIGYSCQPYYDVAIQYQLFHNQSHLNAVESKASAGLNCPLTNSLGRQQFGIQAGLLSNLAVKSGRPGGDRDGWQISLDWRIELPVGELRSQINHLSFKDQDGYSPLLDSGADRQLNRSYVLMQYRRNLGPDMTLMINLYKQKQQSNLELFRSSDNSLEIGLSFAL